MASDDGFKPTEGMVAEAKRGLAWRQKYDRGGTLVGVARARDIVNGKRLSADTVRRMASFFARHEVDKKGKGFTPGPQFPSPGRIAWALWGGDAGAAWSKQIAERLARRGNVATMLEMRYCGFSIERSLLESRNCGTGSGGFQPNNDCARGGGGRYDHSPGEPRIAPYKAKEGASARDAQGREYPPTVTSLADRQAWDDDIQEAELDPGYDPQDVVDDIIVEKFGDVDIEAGFSGGKFISQGANPALEQWMDEQGFRGPPAKAMEQIVRMAEAESWERIKRDARDIAAKKLRARTSTTYPPGKGPIRRWVLDLQKHLLELRQDCGSGDGGFKPGNDCAKNKAGKDGDGDGEFERGREESGADKPQTSKVETEPSEQSQLEGVIKTSKFETQDGQVVEEQFVTDTTRERLKRINDQAVSEGIETNWDKILDMQSDVSSNAAVDFYERSGYKLLTSQQGKLDPRALRQLDEFGREKYGTITDDEIDERIEKFSEQLATDDERDAKLEEFKGKLKEEQKRNRETALAAFRKELEANAAKTKIDGRVMLFRGLQLDDDELEQLIKSGSVNHTGVNSWSTNSDTARKFSIGLRRRKVILVTSGARVGIVNKTPGTAGQENEIIRPPSSMRIQRVVRSQEAIFVYVDEDELYKD